MGNRKLKRKFLGKKAQATLEVVVIIVAVIMLVAAITQIWVWANKQIVERQIKFNKSRVKAGTSKEDYTLVWPVYKPENLTIKQ